MSEAAGTLAAKVTLAVPTELVEAIAARAAALVAGQLDSPAEGWIGVEQAAAHLACPKSRIYRLVSQSRDTRRANPLPYEKDGSRLLFRRSDLDRWLARGGADY
jgi:excisionase family DNA binding protein